MKIIRRDYLAFAAFVALSACATQAQQEFQRIAYQIAAADAAATICVEALNNSSVGRLLSKRLILSPKDPSRLSKMAINEYLTKEEKGALLDYTSQLGGCRSGALRDISKAHASFVVLMSGAFIKADKNRLKLIKGEASIGEANTEYLQIVNTYESEWLAVSQQITQDLNNAHRSEIKYRQEAANAFQQWLYQQQQLQQQQQLIDSLNRPRLTNCHYVGATVSCTSY